MQSLSSFHIRKISSFLNKIAFEKFYGHPIKMDDMVVTLAHKAKMVGPWTTKKLRMVSSLYAFHPMRLFNPSWPRSISRVMDFPY